MGRTHISYLVGDNMNNVGVFYENIRLATNQSSPANGYIYGKMLPAHDNGVKNFHKHKCVKSKHYKPV